MTPRTKQCRAGTQTQHMRPVPAENVQSVGGQMQTLALDDCRSVVVYVPVVSGSYS